MPIATTSRARNAIAPNGLNRLATEPAELPVATDVQRHTPPDALTPIHARTGALPASATLAPRQALAGLDSQRPTAARHGPAAPDIDHCATWQEAHAVLTRNGGRLLKMQAALKAARLWPLDVFSHAAEFSAETARDRAALAREVVGALAPGVVPTLVRRLGWRLSLSPVEAFASLAQPLVERHGYAMLQALEIWCLEDEPLDSLPCHFEVHGQPAQKVIAEALLDRRPPDATSAQMVAGICAAMAKGPLDMDSRIALSRRIAQRADSLPLMKALMDLGISDSAVLCELAREVASRSELDGDMLFAVCLLPEPIQLAAALGDQQRYLEQFAIHGRGGHHIPDNQSFFGLQPAGKMQLFANGLRLLTVHRGSDVSLEDGFEMAHKRWLPFHPQMDLERPGRALASIEAALGHLQPDPFFLRMAQVARNHANPRVQEAGMAWALDAAQMFGMLAPTQLQTLQRDLAFLQGLHAPALRQSLTHALALNVHALGDTERYVRFAEPFSRTHMPGFAVALYPLYADGDASPAPALMDVLRNSRLKNSRHLHAAVADLWQMARDFPSPPLATRRKLLELAVPLEETRSQRCEGFIKNLQNLAVVLKSVMQSPAPAQGTLDALDTAAQSGEPQDAMDRIKALARQRMPGAWASLDPQSLESRWAGFLERSRMPEALIVYRQNMLRNLQGTDLEEPVMKALDRYADAAIWSSDPVLAFARMRYSTQASSHLAAVAALAPAAYEVWQRAATLPDSGLPDSFRVVDTDLAEDLFLCGTEVAGSCMGISDLQGNNHALLGYVIDGKYRMLAVQSQDGATVARRMVRLVLDETTLQPVLYVEKLYANAGTKERGGPADEAMLSLARRKAQAMGCTVVGGRNAGGTGEPYPRPLVSLGSAAPIEYVDAEGVASGLAKGRYEIKAMCL